MLVRHLHTSWQNIARGIYSNASYHRFTDHIASIKRVLCAFQPVYYLPGYGASLFYPVGHAYSVAQIAGDYEPRISLLDVLHGFEPASGRGIVLRYGVLVAPYTYEVRFGIEAQYIAHLLAYHTFDLVVAEPEIFFPPHASDEEREQCSSFRRTSTEASGGEENTERASSLARWHQGSESVEASAFAVGHSYAHLYDRRILEVRYRLRLSCGKPL